MNLIKLGWNLIVQIILFFHKCHLRYGVFNCREFEGQDGWRREKITKLLQLSPNFLKNVFPAPDKDLSITLVSRTFGPYTHIYGNRWNYYLEQQSQNLDFLLMEMLNDKEKAFVQLTRDALQCEKELKIKLEKEGYNNVAHCCGLVVLESFSGYGIAQKLAKTLVDYTHYKIFFPGLYKNTFCKVARLGEV